MTREVSDLLWQGMSVAGAILGGLAIASDGTLALWLWVVVVAFVFEHLLPWDVLVERRADWLPAVIEIAAYVAVGALLTYAGLEYGLGASGLPIEVLAVFVTVVFARGLFEAGLLYGGADAKAMIAAGILIPVLSTAWLPLPSTASTILSIYPFPLTMLMNAALAAVVVPVGDRDPQPSPGRVHGLPGVHGLHDPREGAPRTLRLAQGPDVPGVRRRVRGRRDLGGRPADPGAPTRRARGPGRPTGLGHPTGSRSWCCSSWGRFSRSSRGTSSSTSSGFSKADGPGGASPAKLLAPAPLSYRGIMAKAAKRGPIRS